MITTRPIRRDCAGQRLLFGEADELVVRRECRCGRCGRRLRRAASVKAGFGPKCRRIYEREWFDLCERWRKEGGDQ